VSTAPPAARAGLSYVDTSSKAWLVSFDPSLKEQDRQVIATLDDIGAASRLTWGMPMSNWMLPTSIGRTATASSGFLEAAAPSSSLPRSLTGNMESVQSCWMVEASTGRLTRPCNSPLDLDDQ
jgi:hypothetical protein